MCVPIAWRPGYAALHPGYVVLWDLSTNTWQTHHTPSPPKPRMGHHTSIARGESTGGGDELAARSPTARQRRIPKESIPFRSGDAGGGTIEMERMGRERWPPRRGVYCRRPATASLTRTPSGAQQFRTRMSFGVTARDPHSGRHMLCAPFTGMTLIVSLPQR